MSEDNWDDICTEWDHEILAPLRGEIEAAADTETVPNPERFPRTDLCLTVRIGSHGDRLAHPICTSDKEDIGTAQRLAILAFAFRASWTTASACATLIAGGQYTETARKDMEARLRGYVADGFLVRRPLRAETGSRLHVFALGLRGAQLLRQHGVTDAFGRAPVGLRDGAAIKAGPTPEHDLVAQHVLAVAQHQGHEVVHERELRRHHGNQRSTRTPDGLVIDADGTKAVYVERARKTGWESRQQSRTIARIVEDGVAYGPHVASNVVMVGVRAPGLNHELRQNGIGRYATDPHNIQMLLCDAGSNGRPANTQVVGIDIPCNTQWDLLVQLRGIEGLRTWLGDLRRYGVGDARVGNAHLTFEATRADHREVFGEMIINAHGDVSLLAQTSTQDLWRGARPIRCFDPIEFLPNENALIEQIQRAIWATIRFSHRRTDVG